MVKNWQQINKYNVHCIIIVTSFLKDVAVKPEFQKTRHPQLLCKSKLYKILQGGNGIPKSKYGTVEKLLIFPYKGSLIGFFNPAILTKIVSQSRNPDGLYQSIPIPIIQFCLSPFPKLRRALPLGDDFLNQH